MDQIDQVRQKTDIVELISQHVSLKKAGRNFKGLCPFHDEKTPSFMVSPERQIFKCFGCGIGGDVYKFLMEREGMEFGEALRTLADKAGVELKEYKPTKEQLIKDKLLEINHLASEYYHYLLMEHKLGKSALKYLLKRGTTKRAMKVFRLGFAPNEWNGLENYLVSKKGYKVNELEMVGLVIKGNKGFYDRFRNRIMFTLFDHRKRVVGFAGRVFQGEKDTAKYMNTPETLLYHKSRILYGLETTREYIKKANEAVVVEGEIDAISSYQAGVKNVVAIKGSALTREQVDLIKRYTENLKLALDADSAGDQAARRGIESAEKVGLSVRVINLKYGKDPDECAQKSARLWKDSVKTAVPIYDFYIDSSIKRFGVDTPEGKKKVMGELALILAEVSNQVIKSHYVKKLAFILGVNEESVSMEIEKAKYKGSKEKTVEAKKPLVDKTKEEVLTDYVLSLILQIETEVLNLIKKVDEKNLPEGAVRQVIIKLKNWGKKNKKFNINKFVSVLPDELVGAVDLAYLTEVGGMARDVDKLNIELDKTLRDLSKVVLKTRMEELSFEIKQAEINNDQDKLEKLKSEFIGVSGKFKL
ncbi:MAG: DNA primase [Patescibacteria group bacterium]|nr:DNA primase [Patescibacteria group bacterium]